ncbi:MAG: hypothetical protein KQJ78_07265 [Deltaproteobacteria bacterium]|nr:hypothetical protein [Deltaproteobacteria bacterium]
MICRSLVAVAMCLALAGCGGVLAGKIANPAPGPVIKTGLAPAMPPLLDARIWQAAASDEAAELNVRIFNPELSDILRSDLISRGLFLELAKPEGPAAPGEYHLEVTLSLLRLGSLGFNWLFAPQAVVNGTLLPFYTVTTFASRGQLDLGGYYIPSTTMGVSSAAAFRLYEYMEKPAEEVQAVKSEGLQLVPKEEIKDKEDQDQEADVAQKTVRLLVLDRSYRAVQVIDQVSQHQLNAISTEAFGVELGKTEGVRSLALLSEQAARDPHWAYLKSYRTLAQIKWVIEKPPSKGAKPLDELKSKAKASESLLELFKPLQYTPSEVQVLTDGLFSVGMRTRLFNETRAKNLGLEDPEELPPAEAFTEDKTREMFDDPVLGRASVEYELAQKSLDLLWLVLTPPPSPQTPRLKKTPLLTPKTPTLSGGTVVDTPDQKVRPTSPQESLRLAEDKLTPKERATFPPTPEQTIPYGENAAVFAVKDALAKKVAQAFKGKLLLQNVLVTKADLAVGNAWPRMQAILVAVDSPVTRRYLERRTGSPTGANATKSEE